jgi:hypothetical protein
MVSSLRMLFGGSRGGGDSVVCGSITIGNRQPTERMPMDSQGVWKCRWTKVGGCVVKSRCEEEGGASDVEGDEGSLLIRCSVEERTKEIKELKVTGGCGLSAGNQNEEN